MERTLAQESGDASSSPVNLSKSPNVSVAHFLLGLSQVFSALQFYGFRLSFRSPVFVLGPFCFSAL